MSGVSMRFAAASNHVRGLLFALVLPAASLAATTALAAVQINIDKNAQIMTVAVDGEQLYRWPVSSGLPSYETPNGSFKTFRMEEDHYSKEFDDAPMPHSIFFTKSGHAIHGTDSLNRLGSPASHGCVRLSRTNAATLFALVKREGVLNTTVTLSGSSQVAMARGTQRRSPAVARNDSGQPVQLAPQAKAGARIAENDGSVGYDDRVQPAQGTRRVYRAPTGEYYYAQQPAYPVQQTYPGYERYGQTYYGQDGYQQPAQGRQYYYRY